jgi:hypothetical protein
MQKKSGVISAFMNPQNDGTLASSSALACFTTKTGALTISVKYQLLTG